MTSSIETKLDQILAALERIEAQLAVKEETKGSPATKPIASFRSVDQGEDI